MFVYKFYAREQPAESHVDLIFTKRCWPLLNSNTKVRYIQFTIYTVAMHSQVISHNKRAFAGEVSIFTLLLLAYLLFSSLFSLLTLLNSCFVLTSEPEQFQDFVCGMWIRIAYKINRDTNVCLAFRCAVRSSTCTPRAVS